MILLLHACASPKPITGGPEDLSPPEIIPEASTPNQQTNFNESQIILTFNEWIALSDVYSQLVISPPMPQEPEIRQKGKAVIIDLPDSLRAATTYTINFGNAITDLNEGNPLENYAFVFSTGPVLDSIRISGTVIDAVTLQAAEKIWVMLYHTGSDSVVFLRKPDYLAKTGIDGNWSISYLPADTFLVVALKDENVNFLYDQESEYFGWLSEPVFTGEQTSLEPIFIFPREKRILVKEVIHTVPGWMKIVIEAPVPKPVPMLLPPMDSTVHFWEGDTLHIWYPPQLNYSGYVVLENDSTFVRRSAEPSLISQPLNIRMVSGRMKSNGKAVFATDIPIVSVDTSRIVMPLDSLNEHEITVQLDPVDNRRLDVSSRWIVEQRNPVVFLPGAVTDIWGRMNDTVRHSVVISADDQFGDLFISIDGLDSTLQYVVLLKESVRVVDTFIVRNSSSVRLIKRSLLPTKYTIEIVEDLNRNGAWDTGNYVIKRQPERKMIFMPEGLRAGWEQEVKLSWK